MNLFQKVKMEYSKVEWPSRTEVIHSTIWVVTMTVIISIYLGVFDILAVRALNVFGGINIECRKCQKWFMIHTYLDMKKK